MMFPCWESKKSKNSNGNSKVRNKVVRSIEVVKDISLIGVESNEE